LGKKGGVMKVELVDCLKYTTICRAARIPYKGVSDNGGVSDTALVKKCIKKGHESVVEHSAFCFEITGVSRALTHQQVRHRIASYTQESQRYVKTKEPSYIVPPSISEHEDGYIRDLYEDTMEVIWDTYNRLLDAGVKKEDARFVFPNATTTKIMVTMNLRALINFLKLRMAKDAQWEIREMAQKMYNSLPPEFQSLVDVALEREG
jgi:thymidylate synthase (FAD)